MSSFHPLAEPAGKLLKEPSALSIRVIREMLLSPPETHTPADDLKRNVLSSVCSTLVQIRRDAAEYPMEISGPFQLIIVNGLQICSTLLGLELSAMERAAVTELVAFFGAYYYVTSARVGVPYETARASLSRVLSSVGIVRDMAAPAGAWHFCAAAPPAPIADSGAKGENIEV